MKKRYYAIPTPLALYKDWWSVVDEEGREVSKFFQRRSAKTAAKIRNQIAQDNERLANAEVPSDVH